MSQVSFITGAGREMGANIARAAFAAENAVVATGRNTDSLALNGLQPAGIRR